MPERDGDPHRPARAYLRGLHGLRRVCRLTRTDFEPLGLQAGLHGFLAMSHLLSRAFDPRLIRPYPRSEGNGEGHRRIQLASPFSLVYSLCMPKRSGKKPRDLNELAKAVVDQAIGQNQAQPNNEQPKKNPAAVELGRLGGKKGGPARARKLGKRRRSEIARKAAEARWNKRGAGKR